MFYEMFTGWPAFDGSSQTPLPSGHCGVDRLVANCLAQAPEARFQSMEKVMSKLKLISPATRRRKPAPKAAAVAAPVYFMPAYMPPASGAYPAAPPVQPTSDFESRMTARMEEQERSVSSMTEVASELLKALRQQQQPAPAPRPQTRSFTFDPVDGHTGGRVEQTLDALADRVARLDLVVSWSGGSSPEAGTNPQRLGCRRRGASRQRDPGRSQLRTRAQGAEHGDRVHADGDGPDR